MQQKNNSQEMPESGEYVIGTVTKVFPHGAFVRIDKYPAHEGMIHISELSSKWVKNIREFVEEGRKVVVKVLKVHADKGHIDLSLKSVKDAQRKLILESAKKEKRALKLIDMAGKKINDDSAEKIFSQLETEYGAVFDVLELAVTEGENSFKTSKIPDNWKKTLAEIAKARIEIPKVNISGVFEIESKAQNGVEIIKKAIESGITEASSKDLSISIKYLGAPKYKIEIIAPNYKVAEKSLNTLHNSLLKPIQKSGGSVKLTR